MVVPEEFVTAFNGSLVGPDDVRYDEVRAVHNGLIDRRATMSPTYATLWRSAAMRGWRFRSAAVGTTWQAAPSPTAV